MLLTVTLLLGLAAFVVAIAHAMQKSPLWPGVLLLAVLELLRAIPLGR